MSWNEKRERAGMVQKYLNIEVIGTEISKTATQFPHTIQWNFHDVKEKWIDNVDFIYSNSFDHTYDPVKCLDAWMSCIKKIGVCILEWGVGHAEDSEPSGFVATAEEYEELITNKYILKDKFGGRKYESCTFFVIAHEN